ncbi:MAG TPA: putative lipid II flippase FtsW [Candidatus Baltobacteraceae bacterium]|jgi:cell division protein FtsW|nr:putative lipid II flippase FtsW [Candidatus Baltobacteraceae bacterium]
MASNVRSAAPRGPDIWLVGAAAVLTAIGLVMIFSASSATAYAMHHDALYYLKRQAVWLLVACGAAVLAYRFDYRKLRRTGPAALLLTLGVLILVLIPHIGLRANGAQRWLGSGAFSIQPSEFAKLGLVVYLAAALDAKGELIRSFTKGLFPLAVAVGACALLIFKEPDVGTASLVVFTAAAMFFAAGARVMHLGAVAFATIPILVFSFLHKGGYESKRLLAFLNPWADEQGAGYHIVQSLLALGSGGVSGVGLGFSVIKYFYLPEAHTDFIAAVLGEELGFAGTTLVVALFVLLAYRAVRIALTSSDRFGFLLAIGCTATIVIQAFVNLGVITSTWPVTGVPLPFLSFGGSSLVVSLVCIGLLANIGRRRTSRGSRA